MVTIPDHYTLTFDINTRDELIAFGKMLAKAILMVNPEKQWMLSIGADANSGKELIALAIDNEINPDRYPNGITTDISADRFLDPDHFENLQVVFYNYVRVTITKREEYDREINKFRAKNPSAKVLIASNLERTFQGDFDYQRLGLNSNSLDMNVHVYKYSGTFGRKVVLTFKDERLLEYFTNWKMRELLLRLSDCKKNFPMRRGLPISRICDYLSV